MFSVEEWVHLSVGKMWAASLEPAYVLKHKAESNVETLLIMRKNIVISQITDYINKRYFTVNFIIPKTHSGKESFMFFYFKI
jgi:hypothetical protein